MRSASVSEPRRERGRRLTDFVHLLILCAFALAQPVFEVISNTPEFFSVRDTRGSEVWLFGVALLVVPWAALVLVEMIAGALGESRRRAVHLGFVAVLVWLIALQGVKRIEEAIAGGADAALAAPVLIVVASALALAAVMLYARKPAARTYLTFLVPAPLLFLLLFGQEARPSVSASGPGATRDIPVVVVIFDELPSLSLMDSAEQIDRSRYPAFAELADTSTWYRGATTVADETNFALPAILSGATRTVGRKPVAADYPKNLFTLLLRSHRLQVVEPHTSLCPLKLCPAPRQVDFARRFGRLVRDALFIDLRFTAPRDIEDDLPDVPSVQRHPGSYEQQFADFVKKLPTKPGPVLSFMHLNRPHQPWAHLPSGARYVTVEQQAPPYGLGYPVWTSQSWLVRQGWQRHLLEAGSADRLLGTLLRRMKRSGTFDDSLVVVAADHGVSFRASGRMRSVDEVNLVDIGSVPVFVKRPGQRRGQVVDSPLRTSEILPLIAQVVGLDFEGGDGAPPPNRVVVSSGRGGQSELARDVFLAERRRVLAEKARIFGQDRGWAGVYDLDARPDLKGLDKRGLLARGFTRIGFHMDNGNEYLNVRPRGPFVPAFVFGALHAPPGDRDREVAVLLNGRVVGTAIAERGASAGRFSLLFAPERLRPGRNHVEALVHER